MMSLLVMFIKCSAATDGFIIAMRRKNQNIFTWRKIRYQTRRQRGKRMGEFIIFGNDTVPARGK